MVNVVVALAGSIGSGKTTLASQLSSRIESSTVRAFGDVVRAEAVRRGRGASRDDLQLTGIELVEEGWDRFVGLLLDPPPVDEVLVVEGIRHLDAVEGVRRHLPGARIVLVFVQPPIDVVKERIERRGEGAKALEHAVEAELPDVAKRADLMVSGEDATLDAERVLALLAKLGR